MKIDSEIKDLLAHAYNDTTIAAKLFFPERFSLPFSKIHHRIAKAIDDPEIKQVAIAAPRGFGKTSMCMAFQAKCILYRSKKFIIPVSSSAKGGALLQSDNLKNKLLESHAIRTLFGNLKSANWSKESWIVDWKDNDFKTMVLPRGAGQQIRGVLSGDSRPDLIIVDDLEKDDEVLNEEIRAKTRQWFFASLCNTVNRANDDWKIIYIDTIKHEDCLLQRLLERKDWHPMRFQLGDDNLNTNWPDFISTEDLKRLYRDFQENGEADLFYREYMNLPISTQDASFRQSYFKYYIEGDKNINLNNALDVVNFVIVDPAKTVNPKSAYSAILGGCVNIRTHNIYIRDIINEKLHPDELINAAFGMCERLKAEVLAVEVTSLNEFITYPIKNEIAKRGLNIKFEEMKPREKKENRVRALIPFYRQGYVYHNKSNCYPLETQLLSFPRPKYWDVIDCAAYIVELLDRGSLYFYEDETETEEELEAEFASLGELHEDDRLYGERFDWAPDIQVGADFF